MAHIDPIHICHLIGHKRTGYNPDGPSRHYRRRNRWYMRCDRCGTTDGEEVYREGLLERFTWWRLRIAFYSATRNMRRWLWDDCIDCGLPSRRFGRFIGKHDDDRHMPF
jgi:hypothetical protein